ncbi:MAG: hypothetical protein KF842_01850 [Caulobacter sp.]|nr:hypothetical protein [Caulobacter sp.]
MTDFGGSRRSFEIGRIFERTFGAVGFNFMPFLGLSLLLSGLPQAVFAYIQLENVKSTDGDFSPTYFGYLLVGWLVALVCSMTLQAAIIHGAVLDMNGRKARFADCLATGIRNFLPVLAISILSGLGVGLGTLMLVIPGIFLAIVWVVVVPVRVVENAGVFESFGRSMRLTEGSRWSILLLFVIYVVLSAIVGAIVTAVAMGVAAGVGGLASLQGPSTAMTIVQVVVSPLIGSLSAMIGASGVAAIYTELRTIKEGVVPEQLASVFD